MSIFTERLKSEIKRNGILQKDFLNQMNLNINSIGDWAKRGNIPNGEVVQKIADYFNVTTDWLTGKSQFRTIQEMSQCFSSWEYSGIDNFNPPFDFCSLLKPLREKMNITTVEMGYVIGLTKEQYELCEDGFEPITQAQAEDLCRFLETNIEQVLYENGQFLSDEDIPYEEQDDIKGYLQRKHEAEESDRERDFLRKQQSPEQKRLQLIARHLEDIPDEDRERLISSFESTIDIYLRAKGMTKKSK